MSYWDDVLALSPAVAWMAREASGTNIADDSGNSRVGTVIGTPTTMGDTSLIENEPGEASILVDGTSDYISRNDEAALDVTANNFTAIVTVKPTDLAAQKDIIGKINSWQIWLETSGRITGHFSPPWTSITSSNDTAGKLVAGNVAFLVIRQDGSGAALASIWIGHKGGSLAQVASTAKSNNLTNSADALVMGSASTTASRSFKGSMQAFAYWPNTVLSDAQLATLFATWDTPTTPTTPDAPSITKPTNAQVFNAGMEVTVTDGADTGEYGTLEYKVEQNLNSGGWTTLIDWTTVRPVDTLINVSAYTAGTLELRAYMRRSVSTVSDASATITVTIDHTTAGISTPTISEWDFVGTEIVGVALSAYANTDPTAHAITRVQIGDYGTDFAECTVQTGPLGAALEWEQTDILEYAFNTIQAAGGGWSAGTLLVDDTDYEIRVQYEDALGEVSTYSAAVRVKTAINKSMTFGGVYLLAEDETANDEHGAYTFSASTSGVPAAISAQIHNQRFPYHRISGGAVEYGVLCDNEEYVTLSAAGPWANVAGTAPHWRVRVRGYLLEEAVAIGHGLAGLTDAAGTHRFYLYRKVTTGAVFMQWIQNTGVPLTGAEIDTGITIAPSTEFDIEIIWNGTIITANGATIYTPGTLPDLFSDIIAMNVGHHSRVGPAIGGYHTMEGIWLEYEFDWDDVAEVSYLFTDPQVPTAPTVTKA